MPAPVFCGYYCCSSDFFQGFVIFSLSPQTRISAHLLFRLLLTSSITSSLGKNYSSNYYIEVFSRRYWPSLEAEAAAKAEALLAKMEQKRQCEAGQSLSQQHQIVHGAPGNGGEAAAAGVAEVEISQSGTPELRGTRGYSDVSYSSAEDGGGPWLTSPTEEGVEEEAMEVDITGEDEYGDGASADISRRNTDALEATRRFTTEGQEDREEGKAGEGRRSEVAAAPEGSSGGGGDADIVLAPGTCCSEGSGITPTADRVLTAEQPSQSVVEEGENMTGGDAVGHDEMEPILEKSKDV